MKRALSKFRHSVRLPKASTPDSAVSATTANASPPQAIVAPRSWVPDPVLEDSQTKLDCEYPSFNAPLESLPPEILRQLLSILKLEELRTLVFTSPVIHQQYLLDRRYLLCKCLETTLCGAAVDAYVVYQSSSADFSNSRTREKVVQFLNSYQDRHSSAQYLNLAEILTEDEAVSMVVFFSSIIKPLAQHYSAWALANLSSETGDSLSHEPLTKTEEQRLIRGLYRFQLSCNLFGTNCQGISLKSKLGFQPVDILKIFICIFEPWEVEEIACIYTFAKEKYDQIFGTIRWDVHEKNPKFEGQRPPTPEGAFDFDNSWVKDSLLKGTISCGLSLLYTVLFKVSDHAHLVSTMQEHIVWPAGNFLEEALGETAQFQRRQEGLSNRDQKQQRHELLPFTGEKDPVTDELRPPQAWTLIWRGSYSNLYGYYVQDIIRRWGYVVWDASRLERTGAKEVLMRQWEADWGDSDPRDSVLQ
ncbi:hypothetical protein VFPPC_11650 [Pochonia chlamydosporia 170]|uniref:F-box domain-containing protein n=1 Tax=Pochonia chlamydosporia 170 TaxID=1380566 RepID=A0A179EZ80_METCM|nr:hypothetical protein VFPPC_11650 [Pochonia chlamydosporia 170]OAQ58310.1 hypothetical protein VFPPC_11650 [Pochonia chlamydosporia 170]